MPSQNSREGQDFFRKALAFSIPARLVGNLLIGLALLSIISVLIVLICLGFVWSITSDRLMTIQYLLAAGGIFILTASILTILAWYLLFKLKIEKFGGTLVKLISVGKNDALVLRWKFASGDASNASDASLYKAFYQGLAFYSPWFWYEEANFDLEPDTQQRDGLSVSMSGGQAILIDAFTAWRPDPIPFVMNIWGTDWDSSRKKALKHIEETLHAVLQQVTSIRRFNELGEAIEIDESLEVDLAPGYHHHDGKVYSRVDAEKLGIDVTESSSKVLSWPTGVIEFPGMTTKEQHNLNIVATSWLRRILNDENGLGILIDFKITKISQPERVAAAQDAVATAGLQAREIEVSTLGVKKAFDTLAPGILSEDNQRQLMTVMSNPDAAPELKANIAELLKAQAWQQLGIMAMIQLPKMGPDLVDAFRGGRGPAKVQAQSPTKATEGE